MGSFTVVPNNPAFSGMLEIKQDILFATPDGKPLMLHIIKPCGTPSNGGYPLVIFIQGSAWCKPKQLAQSPQLCRLAARGYAIATVTHRSCFEAAAPAFLVDVKSALRFLRVHAAEYDIDASKVCVWGTSSGGNTALMMGLTGDDPRFEEGENLGVSTKVDCVVDCFGPTDLMKMVTTQYVNAPLQPGNVFLGLGGLSEGADRLSREEAVSAIREKLELISPIRYVREGTALPPFLLLHGDADPVVLYEDSEAMYQKLCACGHQADMVRITGAEHEGSFWSDEVLEIIFAFIQKHMQ